MSGATVIISPAGYSAPTFDYYISPTGSDSNPGTLASPWAITAINSKRATYAGKSVGLLDGVYNINSLVNASGYWSLAPLQVASGSAGSPTVIAAVNARQAIIDGGNPTVESPAIGQGYTGASGATGGYVTLDGLVVRNMFGGAIQFWYGGTQVNTWLGQIPGVTVKNCEVYNVRNTSSGLGNNPAAIRLSNCESALIQNCKTHDIYGYPDSEAEGSGVLTFTSTNCVVEYLTAYNVMHGVYHKQVGNSGHTTRYSYIETDSARATSTGLQESTDGNPSTTMAFYNNIVWSTYPWDGSSFVTPPVNAMLVYNNTFYANGAFAGGGVFLPSTSSKITFYNNIIYRGGATGGLGDFVVTDVGLTLADYNCYPAGASSNNTLGLSTVAAWAVATFYNLANWKSTTGKDAASIAANPSFSGPTTQTPASFQLAGGSPCIGAGRVGGVSGGAAIDMGAWGGATRIGVNF